jgi:hypothetical protein
MKRGSLKRKTPLKRNTIKRTAKRVKSIKKKKPVTLSSLKHKLDAVFSKYIRNKYAINGMVACFTCGKVDKVEKMQNGHFISRGYLATRFDENNCRVQCVGCNIFGNGKLFDFEERLKEELGEEFVEEMKKRRHEIVKYDRQWYIEKIKYYQELLASLQNG